mmetsp:Transcript_14763/g.22934  ORF Transcript_14763/g.22934 Transcript_14763/m.22934 type:complete len:106 (+) Transcript_14763:788-1105(+)
MYSRSLLSRMMGCIGTAGVQLGAENCSDNALSAVLPLRGIPSLYRKSFRMLDALFCILTPWLFLVALVAGLDLLLCCLGFMVMLQGKERNGGDDTFVLHISLSEN